MPAGRRPRVSSYHDGAGIALVLLASGKNPWMNATVVLFVGKASITTSMLGHAATDTMTSAQRAASYYNHLSRIPYVN